MMREWFFYWLYAIDRHSLQSPFIYNFFDRYIRNKSGNAIYAIEKLKKELKRNQSEIIVEDFGAGSIANNQLKRKVSYIAKTSSSNSRFSVLLHDIIQIYQFTNVLELGTSLGFNTLYMASAEVNKLQIHTIEGSKEIADIAAENFLKLGAININLHVGNIDNLLSAVISKMPQIDLAYLDANHTFDATISYFEIISPKLHEDSIVFVDDIHWSPEMKKAWQSLQNHSIVTHSVDIFDAGILFFKKSLRKKHFILEF